MPGYDIRRDADIDIDEIADYIAQDSVSAGRRFLDAVWHDFALLSEMPGAGALRTRVPRRLRGLRSWPVKGFEKYLIFYLPTPDGIEIVRVLHGARNVGRIIGKS